jgi:hypothetical protein
MMTQTCRGCGQPLAAGVSFCPNCGVRSDGNGTTQQPVITQPVVAQAMPQTAPLTTPLPAAVAPVAAADAAQQKQNRIFTWVASGLAALMILGAAAFALRPAAAQGDIVAQGPIGPDGGSLSFDNGGKVQVPPGAVKETKQITVRRTYVNRSVTVGSTVYPPGTFPMYIFGPVGLTFGVPITIILPLPAGAIAGRIYVLRNGRLILIATRPNRGNTVTITLTGFRSGLVIPTA